jgi:hypothetical protein
MILRLIKLHYEDVGRHMHYIGGGMPLGSNLQLEINIFVFFSTLINTRWTLIYI